MSKTRTFEFYSSSNFYILTPFVNKLLTCIDAKKLAELIYNKLNYILFKYYFNQNNNKELLTKALLELPYGYKLAGIILNQVKGCATLKDYLAKNSATNDFMIFFIKTVSSFFIHGFYPAGIVGARKGWEEVTARLVLSGFLNPYDIDDYNANLLRTNLEVTLEDDKDLTIRIFTPGPKEQIKPYTNITNQRTTSLNQAIDDGFFFNKLLTSNELAETKFGIDFLVAKSNWITQKAEQEKQKIADGIELKETEKHQQEVIKPDSNFFIDEELKKALLNEQEAIKNQPEITNTNYTIYDDGSLHPLYEDGKINIQDFYKGLYSGYSNLKHEDFINYNRDSNPYLNKQIIQNIAPSNKITNTNYTNQNLTSNFTNTAFLAKTWFGNSNQKDFKEDFILKTLNDDNTYKIGMFEQSAFFYANKEQLAKTIKQANSEQNNKNNLKNADDILEDKLYKQAILDNALKIDPVYTRNSNINEALLPIINNKNNNVQYNEGFFKDVIDYANEEHNPKEENKDNVNGYDSFFDITNPTSFKNYKKDDYGVAYTDLLRSFENLNILQAYLNGISDNDFTRMDEISAKNEDGNLIPTEKSIFYDVNNHIYVIRTQTKNGNLILRNYQILDIDGQLWYKIFDHYYINEKDEFALKP